MRRTFEGSDPAVAETAFVSEMAYLVGDVVVGPDASVWPFVCVRGDFGPTSIGERTNVQDFTMLHEADIGPDVTIGHQVTVDGASVGANSLVGIGATVLAGATVGSESIVAAGAVVPPDATVPDGEIAYGVPAETRPLDDDHRKYIRWNRDQYLEMAERYRRDGDLDDGETG